MEVGKSAASLSRSFHLKVPLKCTDEVNENSSRNKFPSFSRLRPGPSCVACAASVTTFLAVNSPLLCPGVMVWWFRVCPSLCGCKSKKKKKKKHAQTHNQSHKGIWWKRKRVCSTRSRSFGGCLCIHLTSGWQLPVESNHCNQAVDKTLTYLVSLCKKDGEVPLSQIHSLIKTWGSFKASFI